MLEEQVQGGDQSAGEWRDGLLFLYRTFPSVGFLLRRLLLCTSGVGVETGDQGAEELLKLVDVQQHLDGTYGFHFLSLRMSLVLQWDQDQPPPEVAVLHDWQSVSEIDDPQLREGQVKSLCLHQPHQEVG